jgi:hypothetical protein
MSAPCSVNAKGGRRRPVRVPGLDITICDLQFSNSFAESWNMSRPESVPDCADSLQVRIRCSLSAAVNRGVSPDGALWDGRYKSTVQREASLLTCQRYFGSNPVRTGVVQDPADYRWSSYQANALGSAISSLPGISSSWHWTKLTPSDGPPIARCSVRSLIEPHDRRHSPGLDQSQPQYGAKRSLASA